MRIAHTPETVMHMAQSNHVWGFIATFAARAAPASRRYRAQESMGI